MDNSEELRIGDRASISKTITEADLIMFAGISFDHNPLHMNKEFAKTTRFGERIVHGLLTASLISAVLGTKLPGPGSIYLSQTFKFLKPVKIGDTITAAAEVLDYNQEKRLITLQTDCLNQHGTKVIEGEALLLLEKVRKE